LLPEFGIVGWDIAVTPERPVIIECNDNPHHVLCQQAKGCSIRNAGFMSVPDCAAARSQAILDHKVTVFQSREKAKRA